MSHGNVTTPFGRRAMTLALLKRQVSTAETKSDRSVSKWKVFRDASEARAVLGIQDRALAVLDALLTFLPGDDLAPGGQLIVFPSNAQLTIRAHGIAGTTLRRHLAALVEAGLIIRRDSPNGKRYARKDRSGDIETAFGFDLTPLLARAGELATMAQQVAEDRARLRRVREALTICRRDVRKLITAAMEEGAAGDWAAIETLYVDMVSKIPRTPVIESLESVLDEMRMLLDEVVILLENQQNSSKTDINDVQSGCHKQNSKPESIYEFEPSSRKEQGAQAVRKPSRPSEGAKSFPLGMVLRACPEIAIYGPDGMIGGWRDMMSAAIVVRSMLGVSPSAYQEACEVMGPENAATAVACILERAGHINSAGGYLRDLTRRAERGEFSLGPMLMALIRVNGGPARQAG